jgi:AcrR family transcriptional regulator
MSERRLTPQGRERQRQLLDAAERLFAAAGYRQTRVVDICEAAGVAKGLFYWYFDTKESLFAELVRTRRQELRRAQARAMDPAADPVTRLGQGAAASVRYMAEHAAFFALVEQEGASAGLVPVLREGSEIYRRDVVRLVEEARRCGLIADDDPPELLALGILGAVSAFASSVRSGRLAASVEEVAAFAATWVVRGVAGTLPVAAVADPAGGLGDQPLAT